MVKGHTSDFSRGVEERIVTGNDTGYEPGGSEG